MRVQWIYDKQNNNDSQEKLKKIHEADTHFALRQCFIDCIKNSGGSGQSQDQERRVWTDGNVVPTSS